MKQVISGEESNGRAMTKTLLFMSLAVLRPLYAYDEEVVWRAQIALRGEEEAPLGWVSLSAVREGVRLPILAKADAAAVTDAQTAKAAAEPEAEKVSPERRKRRRSLEHDEAYVPRRYSG